MAEPAATRGRMADLKLRVASAAALAPVALVAAWLGGLAFALVIAVVAVIAFWEWTAITRADEPGWLRAGLAALIAAATLLVSNGAFAWALGLAALAIAAAGLAHRSRLWMAGGVAYVAVASLGMVALREGAPAGLLAILFLFLVVWTTDIAAYFGGRAMGGPKLWPAISPKKTWSGALSGLAGALAVAVLFAIHYGGFVGAILALGAALSVASQAGDLLESAVKRRFGAKDSGRIIPGHGGVLDRIDGLYGAAALAWLLLAMHWGAPIFGTSR